MLYGVIHFQKGAIVDSTTGAGDAFQGGFMTTIWGFGGEEQTTIARGEIDDWHFLAHAFIVGTRVAASTQVRKYKIPGLEKDCHELMMFTSRKNPIQPSRRIGKVTRALMGL